MTEIDDFFANFENKYQQKQQRSNNYNNSAKSTSCETEIDAFLGDVMDEFSEKKVNSNKMNNQDLFSEIKEHFSAQKYADPSPQKTNQNQELFADLQAKFHQNKKNHLPSSKTNKCQDKLDSKLDNKFTEIESKFVSQKKDNKQSLLNDSKFREIEAKYQDKKVQSQVNQPLDIEAIKKEELEKQRRKKALIKEAEIWLKKLDPYSDEGFWFEQFSQDYDSKLEAAMDYLDALNK